MSLSCHPTLAKTQPVTEFQARNNSAITRNGDPDRINPMGSWLRITTRDMFAALPLVFRTGTLQGKPSYTLDDFEAAQ